MSYETATVFQGSRWGAKRKLIRLGLAPYMADAVLSTAKLISREPYVYPWNVNGLGIGVACVPILGLLFWRYEYIVVVGR